MPTINQLSSVDTLQGGDLLAIFDVSNSDARKASIAVLQAYLQASLTFPTATGIEYETQYAVPSATGFNVNIDDNSSDDTLSNSVHLILTPTAGYTAGTITLPAVANIEDKQEVLVNCTQQVTTLTVDGNGATAVTGEPTSMGADDFFRLKFDIISSTWYRIG